MKFRNPFRSSVTRLHEAVAENDIPKVKALLEKRGQDGIMLAGEFDGIMLAGEFLDEALYKEMTSEMFSMIIRCVEEKTSGGGKILEMEGRWWAPILPLCVARYRRDFLPLVDPLLEKEGLKNRVADFVFLILQAEGMPDDERLSWMKKALKTGYRECDGLESLLNPVLQAGFLDGLRLLADIGVKIHQNNEALLKQAAREGKADFCRYLIDERRADLDLAIRTEKAVGNDQFVTKLEELRGDSAPVPSSLTETQARRILELEATVRELTAAVETLRGKEVILDKAAPSSDKALPLSFTKPRSR